jgi:hypothetical protein
LICGLVAALAAYVFVRLGLQQPHEHAFLAGCGAAVIGAALGWATVLGRVAVFVTWILSFIG